MSGLKAALHNPNVSQAAKVRDAARLKELEQELAQAEAAKSKGGKRRAAHGELMFDIVNGVVIDMHAHT